MRASWFGPSVSLTDAKAMNTKIEDERYHRYMSSDLPPRAFSHDPSQPSGSPQAAASDPLAPTSPRPPMAVGPPARWLVLTALAIALISLTLGIVGWFRPDPHHDQPPPKPSYTDQQTADAKARVCDAFGKLDRASGVLNALPHGSDPLVAAINTRQVFDVFSRYLSATLSEEPATPADLATAVRKHASSLEEAVIDYQDGFTNSDPEMQPLVDANTATTTTIRQLCK